MWKINENHNQENLSLILSLALIVLEPCVCVSIIRL